MIKNERVYNKQNRKTDQDSVVGFKMPEVIKQDGKENVIDLTSFSYPVAKSASLIEFEENEKIMNLLFGDSRRFKKRLRKCWSSNLQGEKCWNSNLKGVFIWKTSTANSEQQKNHQTGEEDSKKVQQNKEDSRFQIWWRNWNYEKRGKGTSRRHIKAIQDTSVERDHR